jgi:hypothetical protein
MHAGRATAALWPFNLYESFFLGKRPYGQKSWIWVPPIRARFDATLARPRHGNETILGGKNSFRLIASATDWTKEER